MIELIVELKTWIKNFRFYIRYIIHPFSDPK